MSRESLEVERPPLAKGGQVKSAGFQPGESLSKEILGEYNQQFLLATSDNRNLRLHFLHDHSNTTSDIQILVIASGEAEVKLEATVTIEKEAINSTAQLSIQVVTMDNARVYASPNLEIRTNQAQASHSLNTIRLTDHELFYLTSRGLSIEQARRLVIEGLLDKFRGAERL